MAEKSHIKSILKTLILHPKDFTPDDAYRAVTDFMNGRATPSQISAFLVATKLLGKDSDPTIVVACAKAMREHALWIKFNDTALAESVVDIVGTGGDGKNTFNASTTAAIVAAGAGAKVAKHGNRAASSSTGSADLLESIGCLISNIVPTQVEPILQRTNFCFLFSQTYHPAMKNVAGPRREIGIPTIFNMLGPLSNPAKPRRVLVGVHSRPVGRVMADTLRLMGVERAMVVCGAEGLDEISIAGDTHVWDLLPSGDIIERTVHPTRDFGIKACALDLVKGDTPAVNAETLRRLLDGKLDDEDPVLNFVILNAAALLVVAGIANDFVEGVEKARESVRTGAALKVLNKFREETGGEL